MSYAYIVSFILLSQMSNTRHIANKYLTAGSNRPHSWHPDTKYSLEPTLFPGTGSATKPRTADNTSVGAIILSVVWGTVCLDSCISYLYCMLCSYGCLASFFLKDKASIDLFVLFADLLGCPQLRQSIDTLRAFVPKLFIAFILLILLYSYGPKATESKIFTSEV
ncbi:uncharacterized protein ASPGLDRAFT_1171123 [Aspergillus glaucus CBS 516.65]|uniref:Uncharacterized protein n=1 Tax=Aspergillus glaucus CBS 516.65 TaxID=1160497 RepID=A0A1L9VU26_ASPGL|nr:hypothetical protein ASPGLDRAFT_1171123 [Aspergillus glaucus CBS 516.65]OJJ87400.1 hypothetical protein ASPGLDRAFT_1171123 [Aspergillus glaucus CBS 516.65]